MSQLVTADSTADISLNASHFMASLLPLFHGGRREGRAAPENGSCSSEKRGYLAKAVLRRQAKRGPRRAAVAGPGRGRDKALLLICKLAILQDFSKLN